MALRARTGGNSRGKSRGARGRGRSRSASSKKRGSSTPALSRWFSESDRISLLSYTFIAFGVFIVGRLFVVQVVEHSFYEALASGQHELVKQLQPERGEIYAQDSFSPEGITLLATNRTVHHVYANPKQVQDVAATRDAIAPILGLDPELVETRIGKENDIYEPLKHQVTDQEIEALEQALQEQELFGIHWTPESSRYYPEGGMIGPLTGFVGMVNDERQGQYGLEGYFDQELSGTPGSLSVERTGDGSRLAVGDNQIVQAQDGDTLILTIDKNIQYTACRLINEAVEKHGAKRGTIIVMDPKTGALMGMCDAPTFDPNSYNEVEDIGVYLNDAVSDQYESGSVFKAFTLAAGLDAGVITPYSTYEDTGAEKIGPYTIRNSDGKANGVVDMTTVLELSLNTGTIHVARLLGNDTWADYVEDFGFGERTGITLSGENPGTVASIRKGDIFAATASYGQGITTTPIQLTTAYGAFANGGKVMKPYIVDRVVKGNGYQEMTEPEVLSQPISADAARTTAAMLVRVIDGGHASLAAVDGYYMAGKTGTAQVPNENGRGYHEYRHKDTFVGFGPMADPEFVVLVKIDEPTDVPWSALSAAPVFGDMAQYLVNYLQIPPDKPFAPTPDAGAID